MIDRELVMYSRTLGCPYISIAKKTLAEFEIAYRELYIDKDDEARQFVFDTTGFLSVPTLVIAYQGQNRPHQPPLPLATGKSPRGVNRGSVITEANRNELIDWLKHNGMLKD